MKKQLLFVMDTFPLGGISKSLLALFNEIDYSQYDVDLLLMKREGLFIDLIPKEVNILDEVYPHEFRDSNPRNIINNFESLSFKQFCNWTWFSLNCFSHRLSGGLSSQIQYLDVYIAKHSQKLKKHYDAAIAYQGGRCIYYIVEGINADSKIGYVHSDYLKSKYDYMMQATDEMYFPKLDYLVTISQQCKLSLQSVFPEIVNKMIVIENICSIKMINDMMKTGETFSDGYTGKRLITMARLDIFTKGLDLIVGTCKILKEKKLEFKWYILGDGPDESKLKKMIRNHQLDNYLILLGAKTNPYAYVRDSDIYIQPSRYEGKSVALEEVKALQKPIIVTNYSTVNDQFENKKNAMIVNIDEESIANGITKLINDENLKITLINNLQVKEKGNENQILIFESILK